MQINETQDQCGHCHMPVREYLSGWQHVYRTVESRDHDISGVVTVSFTETYT